MKSKLYILISVFFFWGFVAASNGIFIPFCKSYFNLTQFQSQLIDTAFYGAYFYGALLLYLFSNLNQVDILNKIGYKTCIVWGLSISAIGALFLIGSVHLGTSIQNNSITFGLILLGFFILALGFSLQQTAANPFAVALGDPATGPHRLSFATAINSLGTTVGPILVSLALFGSVAVNSDQINEISIKSIDALYFTLFALFVIVALVFKFSEMPQVNLATPFEKSAKAAQVLGVMSLGIIALGILGLFTNIHEMPLLIAALILVVGSLLYANQASQKSKEGWGAMQFPQLVFGMIAIFTYVGVEVTVQSNLGALLKTPTFGDLHESNISHYISLYWGSLMMGRWALGVTIFNPSKTMAKILMIVVPYAAFAFVLGVNMLKTGDVSDLYSYGLVVAFLCLGFILGQQKPARTLIIFGSMATVAMIIGLMTTGTTAIYAFLSGGLFCSVMWPSIFALSSNGLGKYTAQGATFLIMMILGGAIIPPLQGGFADLFDIHSSYFVAVICFAYLAWFGYKVKNVLAAQGIDCDNIVKK